MVKSCPINFIKADETTVRMLAGFTTLLGLGFLWQPHLLWLLVLLYDFGVRVAGYKKASPFYLAGRLIINLTALPTHRVDAGPKQFAAKIGLIFVTAATGFHLLGADVLSLTAVGILSLCAALEAVLGYCVGCEVYPYWYRLVHGRSAS